MMFVSNFQRFGQLIESCYCTDEKGLSLLSMEVISATSVNLDDLPIWPSLGTPVQVQVDVVNTDVDNTYQSLNGLFTVRLLLESGTVLVALFPIQNFQQILFSK